MNQNNWWRNILICPVCKTNLYFDAKKIACQKCSKVFRTKFGVPMLISSKSSIQELKARVFHDLDPYDIYPSTNNPLDNIYGEFPLKIINEANRKKIIVDVGCGAGKYVRIFNNMNCKVLGIDQSLNSLKLVKKQASKAILINASNLALPLKNNSVNLVISTGVIHHTGNIKKSFSELIRILVPHGKLYLAVYRKWTGYYFVYSSIGWIMRYVYFRLPGGERLIDKIIIPIFHLLDKLFIRKDRAYANSRAIFMDSYLHPVATFHTCHEISNWCKINGASVRFCDDNYKDLIYAIITKK